MQGGRQQYMDLILDKHNKQVQRNTKKINYSKEIYKLTKEELENHEKLIEFINNY